MEERKVRIIVLETIFIPIAYHLYIFISIYGNVESNFLKSNLVIGLYLIAIFWWSVLLYIMWPQLKGYRQFIKNIFKSKGDKYV